MFNENVLEKRIKEIEPLIKDIEIKTTEYSSALNSIHTKFSEVMIKKQELKIKTDELLEKAFNFSSVSKIFETVQKINQVAEESLLVGDETSYKAGKKVAKWGTIFGIGVAIFENLVPLATAAYTSYKSYREQKKWEENFNKQLKEIERLRQELINLKEEQLDYAAASAVEMEKMLLKALPYFYRTEIGKDITYPFYKEKVKPFIDRTSYVLYKVYRLYGLSLYTKSLIKDVKNERYLNKEKALRIYTKSILKFSKETFKISYKDKDTLTAGILYFVSEEEFSSKYSPWNINKRRFLKLAKKSKTTLNKR